MWHLGMFLFSVALFFALTPGILVSLPPKGKKYTVAAVHAVIFAVVWQLTHKAVGYLTEGFVVSQQAQPAKKPQKKQTQPQKKQTPLQKKQTPLQDYQQPQKNISDTKLPDVMDSTSLISSNQSNNMLQKVDQIQQCGPSVPVGKLCIMGADTLSILQSIKPMV